MCSLLTKSRTQRQKLLLITRKREQLQTHLETLETSELNQQVISSVKETSHVLRSMGLTHNVDTVDELMQDMADSHDDVRLIQSGLATNVGTDPDSADLEAERCVRERAARRLIRRASGLRALTAAAATCALHLASREKVTPRYRPALSIGMSTVVSGPSVGGGGGGSARSSRARIRSAKAAFRTVAAS